jgi:hypothetical protein
MTYEFIIQTTDADDITTTHKCYFDSMDELYRTFEQATDDNEDFIITSISPCADINLGYWEVRGRLQTLGNDTVEWEDKAIELVNELCDNPNSEEARKVLHRLRITPEDLFAWMNVEY